jgi:mannose-6-phosphate isomerase-like protein (cupin superfamily)
MTELKPVRLHEKLHTFDEHWSPKIVSSFNGHDVMVVKVHGEFVWHNHDDTDDFFLVLKGRLRIDLPDGTVQLEEGDMFVVPKGMQHRPVADEEAHVLVIEPEGTPNTGSSIERTPANKAAI